jgi:signal transduction histidine kinase
MVTKRTVTVYGLLAAAWLLVGTWQVFEHVRIKDSARAALRNRARDISNSVGVVIRSQRRFGFVRQPRLEAALAELTQSSELLSVALLNSAGEVTVSAGQPITLDMEDLIERGERWTGNTVTVANLVDLGPGTEDEERASSTTIVVRPPDSEGAGEGPPPGRRPRPPLDKETIERLRTIVQGDGSDEEKVEAIRSLPPGGPFGEDSLGDLRALLQEDELDEERMWALNRLFRPRRGRRRGRFFGRRPPWLEPARYQELAEKQGVHAFVLSMSTGAFRAECARDLWLRFTLAGIALVAAVGLGVGWHNLERSAVLQMRLLRASEMNLHLREMNVAAAGLAHETRNPLNIIRGLAQMISKNPGASAEIREKLHDITEEVDRVTGRLNQFIDYSKPPEVRPAPTNLRAVIDDVARALESDIEDKTIQFDANGPELVVEADESLLRQVVFNLLLNSIQAVDNEGRIEVVIEKDSRDEASIEVRDNGSGVPYDAREEIFRPYYTTSEEGAGLGLAVVRQIVSAHQWEITYVPGESGGSTFRVSRLRVT